MFLFKKSCNTAIFFRYQSDYKNMDQMNWTFKDKSE